MVLVKFFAPPALPDVRVDLRVILLEIIVVDIERWYASHHIEYNTAEQPHVNLLAIVAPRVLDLIDWWQHLWRREKVVELREERLLTLEGTLRGLESLLEHVGVLILQVLDIVA